MVPPPDPPPERSLTDNAARYQAIVDMAFDGILTIDEQGIVESVNRAAERIFGFTAAELIGKNVNQLMPAPYREEHDRYISDYLTTGVAKIIGIGREVVGQRKDGSVFPIDLAVSVVQLEGRRIFIGSVRDLTERRRAEVLAEMGIFASGLAHEIGTPMNVILGRADFVRGMVHEPNAARHLDVIIEQVERISRLINQLLAFTRLHPLERRVVDLNHVVENALEVVLQRLKSRSITLETQFDSTIPRLELDPDRMGQIVLNLTLNAIDSMANGGTLRLRTLIVEGDVPPRPPWSSRRWIELQVSDTGCGIPPENLVKVFTPFFTTKDPGRGTGLGLSVVQGLVRDHGGEISVASEVGRGTTFRVRLPLHNPQPLGVAPNAGRPAG